MLIKEWRCATHGFFEGTLPLCPKMGCDSGQIERAFLTAPKTKSARTRVADHLINQLALDYGLSDISNRGGSPAREPRAGDNMLWGSAAASHGFNMDNVRASAKAPIVNPETGRAFEGALASDPMGIRAAQVATKFDSSVARRPKVAILEPGQAPPRARAGAVKRGFSVQDLKSLG